MILSRLWWWWRNKSVVRECGDGEVPEYTNSPASPVPLWSKVMEVIIIDQVAGWQYIIVLLVTEPQSFVSFLPFYDVQLYWKLLQKEYICFTLQSGEVTFWTFSVQCLLLKKNGENKYQRYFTSVTYHHAVLCMQWCFTLLHVVTFHHVLTFHHVVMFHHIGIFYHGLVQTGPEVQKNLDNTCTRCTHWSILWNSFHSIAGVQADSHQCGANLQ